MSVLLMLRSAAKDNLHPQRQGHFGAQSHPPRDSCVRFAADVAAGLAQHSPPGGLLSLTCAGLSPADRASFLALPLPTLRIAEELQPETGPRSSCSPTMPGDALGHFELPTSPVRVSIAILLLGEECSGRGNEHERHIEHRR